MINNPISNLLPTTYFIIAGEESADNHGAELIKSLLRYNSDLQFFGIGGEKMITAGLNSIENIEKMAVMGFIEVIRHLGFFHNIINRVVVKLVSVNHARLY